MKPRRVRPRANGSAAANAAVFVGLTLTALITAGAAIIGSVSLGQVLSVTTNFENFETFVRTQLENGSIPVGPCGDTLCEISDQTANNTAEIQRIETFQVINGATLLPPCDVSACDMNARIVAVYSFQVINGTTPLPPCDVGVCTVSSNLATETFDRVVSDLILQGQIDNIVNQLNLTNTTNPCNSSVCDVEVEIDQEILDRISNDTFLQLQITTLQVETASEIAFRISNDSFLQNQINEETTLRIGNDTILQDQITQETIFRISNDSFLQNEITQETAFRISNDSFLQAQITTEINQRTGNDSVLQTEIDTETSQRISNDSFLQSQITSNSNNINTLFTQVASKLGGFGNVMLVDKIYGNDSTCAANALPCLTIGVALTKASPGQTVFVGPGTYNENFTIPTGVSMTGFSLGNTIIQRLNVTSATDLVVMGEFCQLQQVTLKLTSFDHVQLRGIVFPGTTTATSLANLIQVIVDNSGAGAGTSNVYGVHSIGTGHPDATYTAMTISRITVSSTGSGSKRAVLADTAAHEINLHLMAMTLTGTGTTAYGIETNFAGVTLTMRASFISCPLGQDVSATLGTMVLESTDLIEATANGLGFSDRNADPTLIFGDGGNMASGNGTMRPGTGTTLPIAQGVISIHIGEQMVARGISVRARVAPGATRTNTFIFRVNGVDTPVQTSLTAGATANTNYAFSATVPQNADVSVLAVVAGGSQMQDVIVVVDLY